jgi:outer membrane immunogenic protein
MRGSVRLSFVTLLAGIGLAGAASAADLATKAPAYRAPPVMLTNWSGLFIGVEGGGGWGRDSLFFPGPLTATGGFDTSGAVAGGVIGYNWQTPGSSWVFGLEGNFDWADIKGTTICPNPTFNCGTKIDQIHTATGRIGYAWDKVMVYGKGGYAWSNERAEVVVPGTGAINDATGWTGRDGYTLGAGLEYMFVPNWSAKIEYDYYHFDGKTRAANTPAGVFIENITMNSRDVNVVKAGLNYHFNWSPSPVLAKY